MVHQFVDSDHDGQYDTITRRSKNEYGQNTRHFRDSDADGVVDFSEECEYDADGKLLSYYVDYNGDGVVDRVRERHFDDDGAFVEVVDYGETEVLIQYEGERAILSLVEDSVISDVVYEPFCSG